MPEIIFPLIISLVHSFTSFKSLFKSLLLNETSSDPLISCFNTGVHLLLHLCRYPLIFFISIYSWQQFFLICIDRVPLGISFSFSDLHFTFYKMGVITPTLKWHGKGQIRWPMRCVCKMCSMTHFPLIFSPFFASSQLTCWCSHSLSLLSLSSFHLLFFHSQSLILILSTLCFPYLTGFSCFIHSPTDLSCCCFLGRLGNFFSFSLECDSRASQPGFKSRSTTQAVDSPSLVPQFLHP